MNETTDVDVLVVGGGIGGLATAIAVAATGRAVQVLERSPEFGEIGAGIQLAPNALRVLDRFGVLDAAYKDAVYPKRLVLMDAISGKYVMSMDVGKGFRERYGYPYIVMHRGDLLDALLNACIDDPLVSLTANKGVIDVKLDTRGARVSCSDGSEYGCRLLVGADGVHSLVRPTILGEEPLSMTPFVAYRGTIAPSDAPAEAMLDDMVIWMGPNLHLVQYLVHRGELYNQVAVFKSDRDWQGGEWGTPEELDAHFSQTCPAVRDAARLIPRHRRWQMCERPTAQRWSRGGVTLLGDAAHAMFQYAAQGACQALEDAAQLADELQRYGDDAAALEAYEKVRIPRTTQVQDAARMFGEIIHATGTWAMVRDALLRRMDSQDYTYVDWMYRK